MIFFGSGKFALNLLHNLLRSKVNLQAVVTKTPSQKGSPAEQIAQVAKEHQIPVITAEKISQTLKQLEKFSAQTGVVADFAEVLPPEILYSFPKDLLGLHPSLLPAYRGPAPIQYALLNGDQETGVTLFLLQEEIDSGPIVAQAKLPIQPEDNAETLFVKLAEIGANLIKQTLPRWLKGEITPRPQDETAVSFTKKISKQDARIDWHLTDLDIVNMVRAYYSWPIAYTFWQRNNPPPNPSSLNKEKGKEEGIRLQILEAIIDPALYETKVHHYQPGQVFRSSSDQIAVACGQGAVILQRVKLAGKKEITGQDLLNGYPDIIGATLL